MKIALDAMGGDFAPKNPVAGAVQALQEYSDVELILVGDEGKIQTELSQYPQGAWRQRLQLKQASQVVEMSESGAEAIRRKKDSSISRSVDLMKEGAVEAVVSAGHTGAAVAATTIKMRTLPGVDRPGIAVVMPTETNLFVLIDAGANPDARPDHLVEYAIMGSVYSQEILGFSQPRVGLISIGTEAMKGNEETKEAFQLLSQAPIYFKGNVEGHDLFENPVEVVVCDGFVGNVVLKTSESIAQAIFHWLKHEIEKTPVRKIGALLAKPAFKAIRKKTNYEEYGGMPLLGTNGICIIAHGASTPKAIKNAIRVAREAITQQVNPRIIAAMSRYHESQKATSTPLPAAS